MKLCFGSLVSIVVGTVLLADAASAGPAERFADVKVTAEHMGGSVHMLTGAGGNVGVSVGADGTLIVDDQFAELGPRILAAVEKLGGDRPKLVLNTHYHGDHTGSNAFFGAAGTIVAHQNVRFRLLSEDVPRTALPVVTFSDRVRLYFNDDEIDVIHLARGHTDGDSLVWFKDAGVAHLGDHFFKNRFPYVDVDAGGSVEGLIENLERVLELLPADTRLIPGHGTRSTMIDLAETLDMIKASRDVVMKRLNSGESIDQIAETGLGPEWEEYGTGFINADRWARIIHASANAETKAADPTTSRRP